MNIISHNKDNLAITFTKLEVDDLHLVLETVLGDFNFDGEEEYHRMEKNVKRLYKLFDDFLDYKDAVD